MASCALKEVVPDSEGDGQVQIIYLKLPRPQGHGIVGLLSGHGSANLLSLIARSFNIRKNNCKIEVCALLPSFRVEFFY